ISASLITPQGIAVDEAGNLVIADIDHRIRRVDTRTGVINTIAGNGTDGFSGDGDPATSASLNFPTDVTVDKAGNLFIADTNNNRIRRVDADTGIITTVAGNGMADFSGDGGPATSASLASPAGLAIDSAGSLIIASTLNNAIRVVKSGPSGNFSFSINPTSQT